MDGSGVHGHDAVRLAVDPGFGRIARHGCVLLFVPPADPQDASWYTFERRRELDELFSRFHADGPAAVSSTVIPRCVLEWSDTGGPIAIDTTFELLLQHDIGTVRHNAYVKIATGKTLRERRTDGQFAIVSDVDIDGLGSRTDLRDGDVPAGSFSLLFEAARTVTVEPPQFQEVADLDVTLAPVGPVTYPDDDTDRTFRRPGDIRCPRGHANPNTASTCHVCGDDIDSTADRPGPRESTAVAGLRLPDGSVVPINRSLVVGREPDAAAARLDDSPRLITIDAPGTVSRTHVSIRVDGQEVRVTDCGARGRTAIVGPEHDEPIALTPWDPRLVGVGDSIQLGGPTTLTITDADALRVPASLERTAHPNPTPRRDETT